MTLSFTPIFFKDVLKLFITFSPKPLNTILFDFIISSVDNIKSETIVDNVFGFSKASAPLTVVFDISLNLSSKFKAASLAKDDTADFLPSSFCIPSNIS